jgi:hypothetical protein
LQQQLASDFSGFFEKIQRAIDEIARELSDLEELFDLFRSDQLLHHALVVVYGDVLEFWSQATKIFTRGHKRGA